MLCSSRLIRAVFGVAVALFVSYNSSQLRADTFVRALTAAYDQNSGFNVHDTGQVAGPVAFAASGPFVDIGSSFFAKAYAEFSPLSGPSLGAYSAVDNTVPLLQAFTPAEAWWHDTFTVTGVPGTQVTFNVGMQLHDTLTSAVYPGYPNNLGAVAVANLNGIGLFGGLSIQDDSLSPAANTIVWHTVAYNVGTVVEMGGDLYTDATAQGGTATADAFSTGLFAIETLTPGGGYITESGMVFADSFGTVPEPSTLVMSSSALLVMFGTGRLCRRLKRTERKREK